MAYDTTTRNSIYSAMGILDQVRTIYREAKSVQALLAKYQAASEPVFNATVNAIHPPAERAELAAMLTQIAALISDWEANHATAIGVGQ